jgi:hypothetical protein
MMVWVKPAVRREYERIKDQMGLSLSRVGAVALEEWLAQRLDIQHAGIIEATIAQCLAKGMRAYSSRIAALLVRDLYINEQTRAIAYNMLRQQPRMTDEKLDDLMARSKNTAKRNIAVVDQELTPVMQTIETWLVQGVQETHD